MPIASLMRHNLASNITMKGFPNGLGLPAGCGSTHTAPAPGATHPENISQP